MRVLTVVGARPQFVKAAAVSRALRARGLSEVLVHTGQHYDADMSDVFFAELDIAKPAHSLGVGSGSHGAQTGRMLEALERVVNQEAPDWVLTYGDTNSTLAGALAATKLNVKTAHVEAGLRSFNRRMPEEINRIVADHVSSLLFAPTAGAEEQLRREGIPDARVRLVGDVMYDAVLHYAAKLPDCTQTISQWGLKPGSYVLATIHRAENTDDAGHLESIVLGLDVVASKIDVILPLHPRTRTALQRTGIRPARLRTIPPVGYLEMLALEQHACLIATDSGGVQKEAFFFRVPCRTLREETEWTELVELGWNRLVAPSSAAVVAAGVLDGVGTRGSESDPYGGGRAAERVVAALEGASAP